MKKRFLIYGIAGWILEIIWTGLGSLLAGDLTLRCKTYLWMLPIYGMAVFMEPVYHKIKTYSWVARGFVWMIVIFAIEYCSGLTLKTMVGVYAWNYSDTPLHIGGLIRLDYAPVWFAAGLLFEKAYCYLLDRTD